MRRDPASATGFLRFFPEHGRVLRGVERGLRAAAHQLYRMYVEYYIQKLPRPQLDKPVFVTLCQIHADFLQTSVKRTFAGVLAFVLELPPGIQYQLLTAFGLQPV